MSDGGYCSCLLASIIKKTGKPFLFIFIYFFLFYSWQNVGDEFSSVCVSGVSCGRSAENGRGKGDEREGGSRIGRLMFPRRGKRTDASECERKRSK